MKKQLKKVSRKGKEPKDTQFCQEGANFKLTNKIENGDWFILFLALQQKIDMDETLKFPLTPVLLCLVHIDGSIQKTPKSSLLQEQATRVISESRPNIGTFVIDGTFFLWLLKKIPETFGLLEKLFSRRYVL